MKTVDQVKADLYRRGKSVPDVAREIGVSSRIVYELLRGRLKGHRGQAHRAAVLLGLKDGVIVPEGTDPVEALKMAMEKQP